MDQHLEFVIHSVFGIWLSHSFVAPRASLFHDHLFKTYNIPEFPKNHVIVLALLSSFAAMTERAAKLQKLNLLRRSVPNCSKSSMEAIVKHIAEYGLPETASRKNQTEAAQKHLAQYDAYGPLLYTKEFKMTDGNVVPIPLVNFHTLLSACYSINGSFYKSLAAAIASLGNGPGNEFDLILYADECLPANALGRASKKIWVVYSSIKQLGRAALSHTQNWLVLAIVRTSIVASLEGGMSQVMRAVMEQIFCSAVASPLVGVLLHGPSNQECRLFYKMGFFVQDGASQKITFGLKGDSGSNFCLKCCNQIAFLHEGEEDPEKAVLRTISKAELALATDDEALASWDRMASRKRICSQKEFQQWEQCTGWTYSDQALLSSPTLRPWLRPCTQYVHDFMHGMVSNGTLNIGLHLVLQHLQSQGLPAWNEMSAYLKLWCLPAAVQKVGVLSALFTPAKVESHKSASKVKATASEMLGLYTIVQYHVQQIEAKGGVSLETEAFLKLCHMMDLLMATFMGSVTGTMLDNAASNVLTAFKNAGYSEHCIKKFHWLLHYGDELVQHGMLLPCWTMERKHKDVTLVATRVQNLQSFEQGLLVEVLGHCLHQLAHKACDNGCALELNAKAPKKVVDWLQSNLDLHSTDIYSCKTLVLKGGGVAAVNDVVLLSSEANKWDAGKVLLHFAIGSEPWTIVQMFALLDHQKGNALWQETSNWLCVAASGILAAVTYSHCKAGVLTLIPFHLR